MKLLLGGSPCTHWSIAQTKNRETEPDCPVFLAYMFACQAVHLRDGLKQYEDTGLTPGEIPTGHEMADVYAALVKLKEYVGTGLTPEACANYKAFEDEIISKGVTFKRIVELMDADKDGRCVVLPCKVGDKLFVLTSDSLTGIEETKCKRIVVTNRENGPSVKIIVPCVYDDWGGAYREFYPEDFGKTVFLTREEAEAALSARQCATADCPYQQGEACPAAGGCGGFEEAGGGGDG